MVKHPLVTVFIPYYNDREYLKTAIESVLNQTYSNFELILLNHATKDDCREIAYSYDDIRIRHIDMKKNYGAGGGLLFAEMLKIAKGKYIKPFCADDIMHPDCLQIMVDFMEHSPQVDFAFGNVEYVDANGNDLGDNWFQSREYFSLKNDEADLIRSYIKGQSFLPYIGSIIKRDILSNIKLNKTYIMMFDMHIWASLLCIGYKIGYCNEIIAHYRINQGQISGLQQADKAGVLSYYEHSDFWKIFFTIKDIELAKRIFPDSKLSNKLKYVNDIPFFIAYESFDMICPYMYSVISDMMNDDKKRQYIEKQFGYDIKNLRDACLSKFNEKIVIKQQVSLLKDCKQKVYNTSAKDLNIMQLTFLWIRALMNIILLKKIRKRYKNRKNKRYSL